MRDTAAAAPLYGALGQEGANASGQVSRSTIQRLTGVDQIHIHARQISDLSARAMTPNILFEPALLRATWAHFFADDPSASIILVWDKDAEASRKLIGLLPLVSDTKTWFGIPLGTGFRNDMKFRGLPLVDRDEADHALDQMLAAIKEFVPFPAAFLFDEMPAEGEFAQALDSALARSGWFKRSFDKSRRVMLDANGCGEGYLTQALSRKKRKEYRRLGNRLKDMGELQFDIVHEADAIGAALEDLLQLERQGWKGANHTAILDRDDWSGFFREGIAETAREGQAKVARLTLDGATIAAGLVLTAGNTAWFYKIAYKEELAQYSPGVLFTLELTKRLCEWPDICVADSCTGDDHPMITHLWRERRDYHDLLVVPSGSPAGVIFCAETVRRSARKLLKKGYHAIKRKMRGS